jgi:hypothetical protein
MSNGQWTRVDPPRARLSSPFVEEELSTGPAILPAPPRAAGLESPFLTLEASGPAGFEGTEAESEAASGDAPGAEYVPTGWEMEAVSAAEESEAEADPPVISGWEMELETEHGVKAEHEMQGQASKTELEAEGELQMEGEPEGEPVPAWETDPDETPWLSEFESASESRDDVITPWLATELVEAAAPEAEWEEDETPLLPQGVSPIALQAKKQWDAADRPTAWQGAVFGLVVHTTGSGLPAKAKDAGVYHTIRAVDYYNQSHGCHYVNGWGGIKRGDLLQVANEKEQAAGVGVTNRREPHKDQRRSVESGRFEQDLPPVLVRLWRARWPGRTHSLELLPGTKTANSCYVHVECVPCVYHYRGKLIRDAEPMRPGLRFTEAQHDAVARLAVDIADRNRWPAGEVWWRTPRLLGHEDLTPISRHDRNGGWDPGGLREKPYFDWEYVYQQLERLHNGAGGIASSDSPSGGRGAALFGALASLLGDVAQRFGELVSAGQERAAVGLAYQRGERDPNRLTNMVFFARHPQRGTRPIDARTEGHLAAEWVQIRDRVVKPFLLSAGGAESRAAVGVLAVPGAAAISASTSPDAPQGPFGTLEASAPGRTPFRYAFTPTDALWTARFIVGEAGGRNDLDNQAVIWAMFNRYALFTNRSYSSFDRFIRAYSTPLQPVLKNAGAARRHMDHPDFVHKGGVYPPPNQTVPRGQLRRHLDIQARPWSRLAATARELAERALQGQIPNPGIGLASEFASTQIYFRHRHGRNPRDEQEWRSFTENFATRKNWRWVGAVTGINQRRNAFFVKRSVAALPAGAVRVAPP